MKPPSAPPSRIGLVLGSGSARGLAHIGVIRALEEAGIRVDCIVGASIGALIGAVYASGELDSLEDTFRKLNKKAMARFFDVAFSKSGLIEGARVGDLVRPLVHPAGIESLKIPFCAVATDVQTGEEVVLGSGDITEAVRASISVPGIFTPILKDGRVLVDGGLVNPVPVSIARRMGADFVIAVDLNHHIVKGKNLKPLLSSTGIANGNGEMDSLLGGMREYLRSLGEWKWMNIARNGTLSGKGPAEPPPESFPNIFELLLASVNIMEVHITEARLKVDKPDIILRPPLGGVRFLQFDRAKELIDIGHAHTRSELASLNDCGKLPFTLRPKHPGAHSCKEGS